jgi:hypothetical protein
VLPRAVDVTVSRLRTRRHAPTLLRSPRARRCATTIVAAAIGRCRRCATTIVTAAAAIGRMHSKRRRCASAPKVAGVRCPGARRATAGPSELRHRDHLARANGAERLRDGPAVRVVVRCVRIVAVWLVGVEVGQRRDGIRVGELGCRVGCCGGRVSSNRASSSFRNGVEPGPTRTICWQGDSSVVCVEFWPLYFLVCDWASTRGVIVATRGKHATVIVITYPLPGKLPHKEADNTEHSNATRNRKADDGRG